MNFDFIIALEISPYSFAKKEYKLPKGTKLEKPSEWNDFWKKCLSDSPLKELYAVELGSYFVNIKDITDVQLSIIIDKELEDINMENFKEEVSAFEGGLVIKKENEVLLTPSCCGDLTNFQEWFGIEKSANFDWQQIWIGHPWIFYRKGEKVNVIEFSNLSNDNELKENTIPPFCIPSNLLFKELRTIYKEKTLFEQRLLTILKRKNIKNADSLAKLSAILAIRKNQI